MALVKLHHPDNPDENDFVITGEATVQKYLDAGYKVVEEGIEEPEDPAAPHTPAPAPQAERKHGGKSD